jgi:nucleoside-diphosphate-sugar epimerase
VTPANGPRSVAVTGAGGFVGRAAVDRFAADGLRVTALARRAPDKLPDGAEHRDFTLETAEAAFDGSSAPEVVVHCAARAHAIGERPDPQLYHALNCAATERLARRAAAVGVRRFVFLSTIGVHGPPCDPARGLCESDRRAPETAYACAKAEAEDRLAAISGETGMAVTVIRPALVSGPGAPGNLARLVKLVRLGLPIPVPACGNARAFVDVCDLADLLLLAACDPRAAGETFLAADPSSPATRDVLKLLGTGLGRRVRTIPLPGRLLRAGAAAVGRAGDYDKVFGTLRVDSGHARTVLDWQPRVGVHESLRHTGAAAR